jgi:hypothetical protein
MKQTPLIKSYLEIKDEFPDCIVILRVGDFYETFFNDAKTVSNILGITLTHRNLKADNPIPLTGFPHTALEPYIKKLVKNGESVVIVEDHGLDVTIKKYVSRKPKRFEAGQVVSCRSACDHDCVWTGTILKRTAKTVTVKLEHERERRCKIHLRRGEEFIFPLGNYSMAPVIFAPEYQYSKELNHDN